MPPSVGRFLRLVGSKSSCLSYFWVITGEVAWSSTAMHSSCPLLEVFLDAWLDSFPMLIFADRGLRHFPLVPSHELDRPGHLHQGRPEHPDEPRLERTRGTPISSKAVFTALFALPLHFWCDIVGHGGMAAPSEAFRVGDTVDILERFVGLLPQLYNPRTSVSQVDGPP